MNSEGLRRWLAALREHRARIDDEIEQLEAQLDAQGRAGQKGAEVLEVEPARAEAPTCCRGSSAGNPHATAPGLRRRASGRGRAGGGGVAVLAPDRAGRGPRSRGQIVEEIEIIGILAEEAPPGPQADLQGCHGPALRAGLESPPARGSPGWPTGCSASTVSRPRKRRR